MPRVHLANTENADMYYLIGTRIPDPFFFLEVEGKRTAILNALEIGAFKEHADPSVDAVPLEPFLTDARMIGGTQNRLCKLALVVFEKYGLMKKEVAVPRAFPLDVADALREAGARLIVQHLFLPERRIKTKTEIGYIRENLESTKVAFSYIEETLRNSEIDGSRIMHRGKELTSEFLKEEVEKVLFDLKLDDVEGMIISSGAQAAMPHHKGKGAILPNTTIICDIFFRNRRNQYFGDMTRTYVKGMASETVMRMHAAVSRAQDAAFAALKPGASAKSVFEASAHAIREAGFDVGEKGYIHSLGHGLGLELHEAPNASPHSTETLVPGNVITVEPGLYYPQDGGVRIEDVVVVTERGYENLTDHPRDLIIP
ncbi:aminopeptidase P family protein [Candidatus Kaiserbacteria bacterium]|nr:aminopeptidase P family protein [Candidatus Kaiserbacteria bacterium]